MTDRFIYSGEIFGKIRGAGQRSSRRVNVRKEFMIAIVILTVLFLAAVCFLLSECMNTKAASAVHSYKYYTTIQVQKGDTLWKIAKTYITDDYTDLNAYINEVREINQLTNDQIRYGQYITIPYYSDEYY